MLGVRVMRPVLFGRVVKDPACMALIREGVSRVSPDLVIESLTMAWQQRASCVN
jgi:hypothetical protein